MSPVKAREGSLTRHFMLADIPAEIAKLPAPANHAQAQKALDAAGNQHQGLADRLFAYVGVSPAANPSPSDVVLEDAMVRACRSQDPAARLLVWCALMLSDQRIAHAVESFLTRSDGKLDPSHFDTSSLERYLLAQGVGSAEKAASNILRWFETAGLVQPVRRSGSIVGIAQQLPTSHAARPLTELVTERLRLLGVNPAPGSEQVDLALGIGANRWINLTPDEFRRAAKQLPVPVPVHARHAIPPHLQELRHELYRKGQVILQGPPGTGKTFRAQEFVEWFTAGSSEAARMGTLLEGLPEHERTPSQVASRAAAAGFAGIWEIIQFHPSLTYDDFVRSLRAEPVPGGVTFVPTNRLFGFVCEVGRHLEATGQGTELLLVIDEINRADISKVLGELIYALEYRGQPVTTPYTVDGTASLTVPKNLLLLGTMNTADRSIALIDYALRRRFVYLDVPADRDAVAKTTGFGNALVQKAALALFDATARLFEGSSELRSIQVGHSYFLPVQGATSAADQAEGIARRFAYEVIPLLLEYEAEGRFQSAAVDGLLRDLGLETRSKDGAVGQTGLVAELGARIGDGTVGAKMATTGGSGVAQVGLPAGSGVSAQPTGDDGIAGESEKANADTAKADEA